VESKLGCGGIVPVGVAGWDVGNVGVVLDDGNDDEFAGAETVTYDAWRQTLGKHLEVVAAVGPLDRPELAYPERASGLVEFGVLVGGYCSSVVPPEGTVVATRERGGAVRCGHDVGGGVEGVVVRKR